MIEINDSAVEELAKLYKEDSWVIEENDEDLQLKIIDDGAWEQDGKYQSRSVIVEFKGVLIQINEYRSGSYHTDWYYNESDIFQVTRKPRHVVVYDYEVVGKMLSVDRG